MTGEPPVCLNCIYFEPDLYENLSCKAFPRGISELIIIEGNEHKEPLPEQKNDIVFKRKEEQEFAEQKKSRLAKIWEQDAEEGWFEIVEEKE